MRIQSLRVAGFKSFCHPTSFQFRQNGITIIVGPNGCGKSNVVDSIRWVLGEQRARQMRGSSMEDVIFAGSSFQKPLGMAEVTLTFTNPEGDTLPKYSEYTEIAITRRLYRSGESQYLINKTPVRLMDIRELFMDTGVGSGTGYSIIQQGKVEELINARPEERRNFIDDAAGIVKFRLKRQTAEKRLEETRQNLLRVDDVLQELQRQEEGLRDQVQVARKYLALRQEIQVAEHQLTQRRWFLALQKEQQSALTLQAFEQQQEQLHHEKQQQETELAALSLQQTQLGQNLAEQRNQLFQQERAIQDAENQQQLETQNIHNAHERTTQLQDDASSFASMITDLEAEKRDEEAQIQQLQEEYDSQQSLLRDIEDHRIAGNQALQAESEQLQALQRQLLQVHTQLTNATNQLNFFEERLSQQQERLSQLRAQQRDAEEHFREAQQRLSRSSGRADVLEQEQVELHDQLTERQSEYEEQKEGVHVQEQQLKNLQYDSGKAQSRLRSLEEIQSKYEDFSDGVQQLLEQLRQFPEAREQLGFCGIFADFTELLTDQTDRLAPVLSELLDWVVLRSIEQLPAFEAFCQQHEIGRLQVLALDQLPEVSGPRPQGETLASFVRCKAPLTEWSQRFFERVVLLNKEPHAWHAALVAWSINAGTTAWVSPQGSFLPHFGNARLGRLSGASFGFLQRQQEITQLRQQTEEWQIRIQEAEEVLEELQDAQQERAMEIQEAQEQLHENQLELSRLQQEQEHNEMEVRRAEGFRTQLGKDLARIAQEEGRLREEQQQTRHNFEHAEQQRGQLETQVEQQQEKIMQKRRSLEEVSEEHTNFRLALTEISEQLKNHRASLERNQRNRTETAHRLAQVQQALEEAQHKQALSQQKLENLKANLPRLLEQRSHLAEQLQQGTQLFEAENLRQAEMTKALQGVQKQLEASIQQAHQEGLQQTEHRLRREQLETQLLEQWGHTPEELRQTEPFPDLDESAVASTLRRQKSQLESMGAVNLAAPEEYDALVERLNFLQGQSEDLTKAADDLEQTIREINVESRRRFRAMFEQVNAQFSRLFVQLFGGGEAKMSLTDSEDVLDSGIEILAQPPGKKLQNLNLLSGGEKALTAISLIFAIFLIKPSPFCILDEVDAPLDDANVVRFNRLIQSLTHNSQFVIITHNKKTMEIGDALYGVTMEEPGVSKTVSVQFSEAEKLAI
jgi:chromosome segregation protein